MGESAPAATMAAGGKEQNAELNQSMLDDLKAKSNTKTRQRFTTKLEKPPGSKLGVFLVHLDNALQIEEIFPGSIVDLYSQKAEEGKDLRLYDTIVAVNGTAFRKRCPPAHRAYC